ncbi:ATP-dependent DNA helicase [Caligus rogercresseyi]|uniref:ATP-dependent DNA helicase n=1 Tax=Caligus rogercresseyi TaxID=217165 RepID=A0A7T8HF51_CALRO|nr:ATP-dependent DNA helicase [Caligus rogercresseyi]
MAHKNALHTLDKSLKDIRSIDSPFGGVVLLLAGDFRQTLPSHQGELRLMKSTHV